MYANFELTYTFTNVRRMAKPKYYLNTTPDKQGRYQILLACSFGKIRLKYYPGISINKSDYISEYWKTNKKPIKSSAPFATQYNQMLLSIEADTIKILMESRGEELNLASIRNKLDKIYKPAKLNASDKNVEQDEKTSCIKEYLKVLILEMKDGTRLITSGHNKGSRYGVLTIKNYESTLSALERFSQKPILFDNVNASFYEKFRNWVYGVEKKEQSTFSDFVKNIKAIMRKVGRSEQTVDFIKPSYESDTIYLNMDQIAKMSEYDFSDPEKYYVTDKKLKIYFPVLDRVRDLFLIGAYTGLRFSDFSRLDASNIEGNFIRLKQQKTGGRVTIPIMSKLKPVLAKYPDVIPEITNQKFNQYIKYVAELVGLTEDIQIKNTRGNTVTTETFPLFELISSHCCRRSYATNMFKAGVPPMLIMGSTGHKTETSFLRYIRASSDDKAYLLAEAMKKLGL